ncbi:MAG: hypothetical protein CFE32_05820 [Alphaproteobacteria bacterium PA3]|nr:MAG: hypothetical protein CFE32_05820 [Alphaproteobacteria bacterium PA3]
MGGGGSDQFFVNAGDVVSTGSGRDAIFLFVRTLDDNFDGLSVDESTSSEETLEQKTLSVQSRVDSLKPDVLIINDFDSTSDELIVVHDSMHGASIELKCELIDGNQVLCLNGDAIARLAGPADFSIDRIRLVRLDELGVTCHPITPPS